VAPQAVRFVWNITIQAVSTMSQNKVPTAEYITTVGG